MYPIAEENLIGVEPNEIFKIGNLQIQALHTPGHAVHHIAWKVEESIFTGDVAGVMINDGPVVPPCPPPDIHLEDWKKSILILKGLNPKSLYLTHYGLVTDPQKHLTALENILDDWASWMKPYFEASIDQKNIIPKFMEYTKSQLTSQNIDEAIIQVYEYANPSWMSVAGLMRYWKLKSKGVI
jgi:glyoxylase-like metal-dependent hydrolase (beta-lactamase superfamily II)